jgi:two-component system, cell cycle sensor histidine kinase and response regulator CckA
MPGPDTQPLPNIPLIHRPGDQAPGALNRPPLAERKRLLIVDDEMPILKLVTRILATDNYEITSAISGEAAAQFIAQPGFTGVDLLVTDLLMPGMNGRQLAAIVRQRFPKARVLYVTGFADTLFQNVQELGEGESFIEKPFGTDGLLEATRLLMFGHISDGQEPRDKHDDAEEWQDDRLRAKLVKFLRRLRMA